MQAKPDFSGQAGAQCESSIIRWIARSYETMEEWKCKARSAFYLSNGDSNLARNRVAGLIRSHFLETSLTTETVMRWKPGINEQVPEQVVPPKVTAFNSAYIDWLCAADYILSACAPLSE